MECYVTWNIGQNRSITYESAVQMEVTVVKGRLMQTAASVCVFQAVARSRQMCPGEQSFLLPPRFISTTPSVCAFPPVSHPR